MRAVATLLLALPGAALGQIDPRFTALRDSAETLVSVGAFVEKYVGDCASPQLGGNECKRNAEAFRRASNGKKFALLVSEGTGSLLQMGEVDGRTGHFVLNLTPCLSGSNSAVTHGAPSRLDANGNVVLPFLRLDSVLPDGWNPAMMARQVQAQSLRLQVVLTVQDLWTLPKKSGGKVRGIKTKFEAVVVTDGRTGAQIGSWFAR